MCRETKPEQAEFGITLASAFHGHGYATEAIRAMLRLAFDTLGKHRVFGSVDPRNARSIALMRPRPASAGRRHFVESLRFKDEWVDDVVFAMLAREWQRVRSPPAVGLRLDLIQQRVTAPRRVRRPGASRSP